MCSLTEKDPVFIDVFEDGLRRTALECHLSLFNTSMIQGSTIDLSGNTAPIEVSYCHIVLCKSMCMLCVQYMY